MWIGPIPIQLSQLTVTERSLISRYHPWCYVYKLYPRDLWAKDTSTAGLQSALVSNVTTFSLNLPAVVNMVSSKLLTRPIKI
jgi:hypothetical protein